MRNVRWLVAAGLLVSATGCIEVSPGTSYPNSYGYGGYPSSGYYGQNYGYSSATAGLLNSLFSQPAYQPAPAYYPPVQTQYVPVPVAQPQMMAQPPMMAAPQMVSQPQMVTQPRYISAPMATASGRPWGGRDRNNNGVPDWKERDRNGDGIPDYQQRRHGPTG